MNISKLGLSLTYRDNKQGVKIYPLFTLCVREQVIVYRLLQ